MSGVFLRQGDALVQLREAPYNAESVLQELLERYPELLAGEANDDNDPTSPPAWLLVRREASIALGDGELRGMLDHLFLDGDGVPTLVEVKRSSDTRIRREVVGQLLDYAANASTHWSAQTLRTWFETRCTDRGEDPERALRDAFPAVEDDADYWETVRTNLAAGRLRLVFVADVIPPSLRRIVEFLNTQMAETEVLAIEVRQYVDASGTQQTLVPRVIGQTEAARAAKGRAAAGPRWTRALVLQALAERSGDAHAEVARRLFAWADARGDLSEGFGRGSKDGSWQVGWWEPERYLWPFVLYTYGRVEVQFQHVAKRRPFDDPARREQLRQRLNAIDGVEIAPELLDRRPSIPLDALASEQALAAFTDAIDWAFAAAAGDPHRTGADASAPAAARPT
ncbi:MAG TPA: hypothetical protein VKB25_05790 [Conexibacter sp.]|nr:hypothetical protein [Conexibacter sp.]